MNTTPSGNSDWPSIVQLRATPKLKDFCPSARHLFENYFQIGPTEYVRAQREWKDGQITDALEIDAFYWAPTSAAFSRLAIRDAHDLASDDGTVLPLPEALRPAPDCLNYGAIHDYVSRSGVRSNELDLFDAQRRWKSDGSGWMCIGSCFSFWRCTYYFRSPLPIPPNENPYAARFQTRNEKEIKRLWMPTD